MYFINRWLNINLVPLWSDQPMIQSDPFQVASPLLSSIYTHPVLLCATTTIDFLTFPLPPVYPPLIAPACNLKTETRSVWRFFPHSPGPCSQSWQQLAYYNNEDDSNSAPTASSINYIFIRKDGFSTSSLTPIYMMMVLIIRRRSDSYSQPKHNKRPDKWSGQWRGR